MSVRLELSDLPPRIRAQAEAQIAARGQKRAPATPSMAAAARYTADFVLTYADGTMEVVEVKSKFTRRQQRDYIYRRRLFIDLVAEPRGWRFVEHITPDTSAEIKAWKRLAKQKG